MIEALCLESHLEDWSGHGSPQFNLRGEREFSRSELFLGGKK